MASISRNLTNYTDLDLDFDMHPVTHDVTKKVGIEAIKRSIRNIVLTNFYDRPFRSYIGSNINKMLFDNADSTTARLISQNIETAIANFEPRAVVRRILVSLQEDSNALQVDVEFTALNAPQPITVTVFLERIR